MRKLAIGLVVFASMVAGVSAADTYSSTPRKNNFRIRASWTANLHYTKELWRSISNFNENQNTPINQQVNAFEQKVLGGAHAGDGPMLFPTATAPTVGNEFGLYTRRNTPTYETSDMGNGELSFEVRIVGNLWVETSWDFYTATSLDTYTIWDYLRVDSSQPLPGTSTSLVQVARHYTLQHEEFRANTFAASFLAKYDLSPGRWTMVAPSVGVRRWYSSGSHYSEYHISRYDGLMPEFVAGGSDNGMADHRTEQGSERGDVSSGGFGGRWQGLVGLDLGVGCIKNHCSVNDEYQFPPISLNVWVRRVVAGSTKLTYTEPYAAPLSSIIPEDRRTMDIPVTSQRWYVGFGITATF